MDAYLPESLACGTGNRKRAELHARKAGYEAWALIAKESLGIENETRMETVITRENYRQVYESLIIRASDKFEIPPIVLRVNGSVIGTLGNFSASTGKGKSKKTFNVCAIVAAAISGNKVLEYEPSFRRGKGRSCISTWSRVSCIVKTS